MSNQKSKITYSDSGVDIGKANDLIDEIKPMIKETLNDDVLSNIGGFGALFELNTKDFERPVLVSGTDGVGTKVKLAQQLDILEGVGIDLVAMCVNDIITSGAKPLFFLDYFATSALDNSQAKRIIKGIADGCLQSEMALIGGETAEMPGVYQSGDFDLAGFCVGIVDYDKIIDGSNISEGDAIIGLASSGAHSNGYSLIRKLIEQNSVDLDQIQNGEKLGKQIINPTTIYSRPVLSCLDNFEVKSMAHITGGGFQDNIIRAIPKGFKAIIDTNCWNLPPVFQWIQKEANIDSDEMLKTFNCGIGYVVIVRSNLKDAVIKHFQNADIEAYDIGFIESGEKSVIINHG
ncbi:MAG: phosphoribosylformylglycinamidine cyclo-ligase [Gammaproteobacteria bacterium]|jgi:phosphoribosylformylglycinamidine cyclo-ligase|nr:phosphoribosylformylglycinamidine cyclo-ligase [Gammaproteobacteria bacterium]MBQ09425.1 phosphoribosylformylglycinamidine cyclo-ligase [Gammaproteobacteria bacterium]MDP6146411.1 phosphoribosylformylglycinamidine cyclo-ligase [Gammaproteobacteria bacterium]HJL80281.1 phosphoribosylformylglycinamidine cyclo-ligase [Gammaproteobacteria bacterium]HJM09294.1 phosphoribosylformylglycinamidine cyclo-ligase [Gammaproteobacteria bacterium]|tara:strand:- start:13215 stop:14255 length:1041 start_codon:yes stop_codon:yes gene_type:complete